MLVEVLQRVLTVRPGDVQFRALTGEGAQEVVHRPAVRTRALHEVGAVEHAEQVPADARVHSGERGDRVGVGVAAGMQSQQPEQAVRRGWQVPFRPGEHGTHGGVGVGPGLQLVQAVPLVGEVVEAHPPAAHHQLGRDPQRQWQPGAPHGQILEFRRGGHVVADQRTEQLGRAAGIEHVQPDPARAVARDEPGEVVATGDHDGAARPGRQQRADVGGVAGVVEHHQDALARGQAPVERDLCLQEPRHAVGRDAECGQEPVQRLLRRQRSAGVEPSQVDVELPVGEPRGDAMSPSHSQCRLAHTGRAAHRDDGDRVPCRRDRGVDRGELGLATGEARHQGRQLRRCRIREPERPGRDEQPRVVREHLLLDVRQHR